MKIDNMLPRILENRLSSHSKSVLLLGPRQVGKSTLIKSLLPDYTLNLSDEEKYLQHLKDPGLIKRELLALASPKLIAIDEIQRIPSMLNTVQYLIDEKFPGRFILTGSSARKLKRGGANLLPGRIVEERLSPLLYWELKGQCNLQRCLTHGSLPGIYLENQEGLDVLKTYAATYVKEEIQAESLTRNIAAYSRFIETAAGQSGAWVNYSKIASDSEVTKDTIRRFYELLEDTLIAVRLPPFRVDEGHRRLSQRDRILFFDLGVRHALLGLLQKDFTPTEMGHLFEHWVILQCYFYAQAMGKDWRFFSFRTDTGDEVDLVIQTAEKLILIEVKAGTKIEKKQMKGLKSFERLTGRSGEQHIIFQGERAQKIDDILISPYADFFEKILPEF